MCAVGIHECTGSSERYDFKILVRKYQLFHLLGHSQTSTPTLEHRYEKDHRYTYYIKDLRLTEPGEEQSPCVINDGTSRWLRDRSGPCTDASTDIDADTVTTLTSLLSASTDTNEYVVFERILLSHLFSNINCSAHLDSNQKNITRAPTLNVLRKL